MTVKSILSLAWDWLARFSRLPRKGETVQEFGGSRILLDTRPHLQLEPLLEAGSVPATIVNWCGDETMPMQDWARMAGTLSGKE